MKVLLGITGSVAAILCDKIVNAFLGDEVRVVATESAEFFIQAGGLGPQARPMSRPRKVGLNATLVKEADEWKWRKVGDPILHIELRDWMDVMVVAPLSANTLGKMANGICDNLLLSVWLASGKKPVVVAPAMNAQMWSHPAVENNVRVLSSMGVRVVDPMEKKLACGETGVGAMAPIVHIVGEARHVGAEYVRRSECARLYCPFRLVRRHLS